MLTNKAVVALNGELKGNKEEYKKLIGEKDVLFVAADGGALLLESIGFLPDVIIGDFDSLLIFNVNITKKWELRL